MKKIYVCIDAGGTSCKAGIFDEEGNILSRGTSKSGSPAVSDNWYLHIDDAIKDSLDKLDFSYQIINITMGVSGLSAKEDTIFEKSYFESKYHTKCNILSDTMTALYSVIKDKNESGIIVISGTGIAIFGKNKAQNLMIGGWGHIIRELGSSYSIVHDFCVNLIDKFENQIAYSNLELKFIQKYHLENIRKLNHLFYNHTKDEIAKLSIFFKEEAKNNNLEAKNLLKQQGVLLAKQTYNLIKHLNLPNHTIIGLTGGFIENDGEDIVQGFKEYLEANQIYLDYNTEHNEQLIGVYYLAKKGELC